MQQLNAHIEALIFASEQAITLGDLCQVLSQLTETEVKEPVVLEAIISINEDLQASGRPYRIRKVADGYVLLTEPEFYGGIQLLNSHRAKKKLSQAALETLAIIAYRQPITKLEIENIRGVNCDYTVQKLLEKELISISGKAESVGKPLLYSTSPAFMDHFGLASIADLPQLKDLAQEANSIGEEAADKKD